MLCLPVRFVTNHWKARCGRKSGASSKLHRGYYDLTANCGCLGERAWGQGRRTLAVGSAPLTSSCLGTLPNDSRGFVPTALLAVAFFAQQRVKIVLLVRT